MSSLPDSKELNKIIALCRKQGIKTIKIGELELTLSDTVPAAKKPRGKSAVKVNHGEQGEIETDGWESLTEEERLFWSASGGNDPFGSKEDKT